MVVSPYLHISQYTAFLIAIFSNSLLLYLIRIGADETFGRYRIMMNAFSMYSIVYATIEILTQPVTHIHGSGCMFYVDSFLKDYYSAGVAIATMYCASFALCISMLAMQFVYRYIAVCKNQKLWYFEGNFIFLWLLPPLLMFFLDASVMLSNSPTTLKRNYFRRTVIENYKENIDELPFLAPLYFVYLKDGTRDFFIQDVIGAFVICGIMSLCFGTCVFCAYKTYKTLHDVAIQMSPRTRSLNKQLFWTLFLQTLLPSCTQYLPVGLLLFLPLFQVDVGRGANLVGVVCSLYPALDPLIAIFMIDKFRKYIFGRKKVSVISRVSGTFSNESPAVLSRF